MAELLIELLSEEIPARMQKRAADDLPTDFIPVFRKSAIIAPKTDGQKAYAEAVAQNDLCFCVGPAGTGKTYLAVAMALSLAVSPSDSPAATGIVSRAAAPCVTDWKGLPS